MLDEDTLNKLADNALSRMWGNFLQFGSASAGIIELFIIARIIKFISDTIIHEVALHSLYGFSIHLFGSVWNSITQLLLHIGQDLDKKEMEQNKQRGPGEPSERNQPKPPAQPPKLNNHRPSRLNNTLY